jgi:peroxin-19
VSEIIKAFDQPNYKDEDPETSMLILRLMTEVHIFPLSDCPQFLTFWLFPIQLQMQSFGSPPAEIMGPMPPGFTTGPDGMPQIPDECVVA